MSTKSSFLAAITEAKRAEMALVSDAERATVRAAAFAKRAGRPSHRFRQALAQPGRSQHHRRSQAQLAQRGRHLRGRRSGAISHRFTRRTAQPQFPCSPSRFIFPVRSPIFARFAQPFRCPALRKDFIVDSHQIFEAAAAGAEAVLLIVASLAPAEIVALRTLAEDELGMDALVEVHAEPEMHVAIDCGARIIGVNNRNLATLAVDLGTSRALARYAQPGRVLVSESGLRTADDLRQLWPWATTRF